MIRRLTALLCRVAGESPQDLFRHHADQPLEAIFPFQSEDLRPRPEDRTGDVPPQPAQAYQDRVTTPAPRHEFDQGEDIVCSPHHDDEGLFSQEHLDD